MVAWVIAVKENIFDQEQIEIYQKKSQASILDWIMRGHTLTRMAEYAGTTRIMEGDPIEGISLTEFPSVEAAEAFYNSPMYQEAIQHRFKGGNYKFYIIGPGKIESDYFRRDGN